MDAPAMTPVSSRWIRMNLPKRDELRLRLVAAFPNTSVIGLAASRAASIEWSGRVGEREAREVRTE